MMIAVSGVWSVMMAVSGVWFRDDGCVMSGVWSVMMALSGLWSVLCDVRCVVSDDGCVMSSA